jgi:hypothetical protein
VTVDKRTVATDALESLGMNNIPRDSGRDAIHLAVEPVICAGDFLLPGADIGIKQSKGILKADSKFEPHVGIVDPFLKKGPVEGELFWLVVYPRQITSLRHVWTHPSFDGTTATGQSNEYARAQEWIVRFAEKNDVPIQELLDGAGTWIETYVEDQRWGGSGEYLNMGHILHGLQTPQEFWEYYEILTQNSVPEHMRKDFFACSC